MVLAKTLKLRPSIVDDARFIYVPSFLFVELLCHHLAYLHHRRQELIFAPT